MRRSTQCLVALLAIAGSMFAAHEGDVKRGNYYDALMRDAYVVYDNPAVTARVNDVGQNVVEASGNPHAFDFRFFVINSSDPTAFAVPGGYVYITSSLLENLRSEDELAAVLAHEIGHVNERHAMKIGMSSGAKTFWRIVLAAGSIAAAAYIGTVVADAMPATNALNYSAQQTQMQLVQLSMTATQMSTSSLGGRLVVSFYKGYDEEYEFVADDLALKYVQDSGYDPDALIAVLSRIGGDGGSEVAGISHLHSDAALLEKRNAHARETLDTMNGASTQGADEGGK